ncbi:ankyrin repeat-containing domain protein, partial [Baffinella frigidus]
LHCAAFAGNAKMVYQLLDKGADRNVKTMNTGETPLHVAVDEGNEQMVLLLLEWGADCNAKTTGGDTPLHLAAREGRAAIAQMLLDNGADDAMTNKGKMPLFFAKQRDVATVL